MWCTNVFCNLVHVSVTLCLAPTRRASATGECCLAAGLSCQQPVDERQQGQVAPRIPFHFHFPLLGISQPLHIPVKHTDCLTAARCLQSRGLGKVQMGSRNGGAMRSSGGSIHEPVAWLVDGVGSVGGELLVPTSSLVRMTVGFIAVSD